MKQAGDGIVKSFIRNNTYKKIICSFISLILVGVGAPYAVSFIIEHTKNKPLVEQLDKFIVHIQMLQHKYPQKSDSGQFCEDLQKYKRKEFLDEILKLADEGQQTALTEYYNCAEKIKKSDARFAQIETTYTSYSLDHKKFNTDAFIGIATQIDSFDTTRIEKNFNKYVALNKTLEQGSKELNQLTITLEDATANCGQPNKASCCTGLLEKNVVKYRELSKSIIPDDYQQKVITKAIETFDICKNPPPQTPQPIPQPTPVPLSEKAPLPTPSTGENNTNTCRPYKSGLLTIELLGAKSNINAGRTVCNFSITNHSATPLYLAIKENALPVLKDDSGDSVDFDSLREIPRFKDNASYSGNPSSYTAIPPGTSNVYTIKFSMWPNWGQPKGRIYLTLQFLHLIEFNNIESMSISACKTLIQ
jgi:hypothetical protein